MTQRARQKFYQKLSRPGVTGAIIIVLALIVRLGYWQLHPGLSRDGLYYLDVIREGTANSRFYDIPPCFSAIMRGALRLRLPLQYFGVVFNIICGSLLPYIGYRIARKLKMDSALAVGIGIFLIFFPPLVKNSADFLREPLFLLLGATAMLTALHQVNRKKDCLWMLLSGVFAAGSISVRLEGFEFVLLISIIWLWQAKDNRYKYLSLLTFATGCILPLLVSLTLLDYSGNGYNFLIRRSTYYWRELLK